VHFDRAAKGGESCALIKRIRLQAFFASASGGALELGQHFLQFQRIGRIQDGLRAARNLPTSDSMMMRLISECWPMHRRTR